MEENKIEKSSLEHAYLADVVHDLRAPLTAIIGFVDGILSGTVPKEKHEAYLTTVSEEAKRLSRMVSELLEYERILAGEQRFDCRAFDLAETARRVLISLEARIEEKGLGVSFDAGGDRTPAFADPNAIHRVVYNLCDNAVKFSGIGGTLALTLRTEGGRVSFSVRNEGEGIPPDALPHVFDRFYSRKEGNPKGLGIGLFVSKAIVDANGGEISAESVYGEYATFKVTLPKAPLAAES